MAKTRTAKAGTVLKTTSKLSDHELEWVSHDRAHVKLYTREEVNTKKDMLKKVVNEWIRMTGEGN